jgi:hypothetical protein
VIKQVEMVGTNVLLAGDFTSIEGVTRQRLALVDPVQGSPLSWRPSVNGPVNTIAFSPDGVHLFIGGSFSTVSGQPRKNVASIAVATGALDSWVASPNGVVNAIAVSPTARRVYIGGSFTAMGLVPRKKVAALDYASGVLDATWQADVEGGVLSLAVNAADTLFVGGRFTSLKGKARQNVGAVDVAGNLLPWQPYATDAVLQIVLPGDGTAWLAGSFTSVRWVQRLFLAHVNLIYGDPISAIDPYASAAIRVAVPLAGGRLFIGGDFTSVNATKRAFLARLDATTGVLDPTFTPVLDGPVLGLDLSDDGSMLYISGRFQNVNGVKRRLAAALWLPSGAITQFNPDVNGYEVAAIDQRGDKVAIGGQFDKVGGLPIANAARLDVGDGSPNIVFRPNPNAAVRDVDLLADDSVIIAGDFTKLNVITARQYVALIGPSGGPQPWNPKPSSFVFEGIVSPDGSTYYAGLVGPGGQGNAVEAFTRTGEGQRLWRTEGDGDVQAIALSPDGQTIYAGGHFFRLFYTGTSIVMDYRNRAMAVRASDGGLLPWAPPLDFSGSGVYAIAATSDAVYLGGDFTSIGSLSTRGLALFHGQP